MCHSMTSGLRPWRALSHLLAAKGMTYAGSQAVEGMLAGLEGDFVVSGFSPLIVKGQVNCI
jgi:hypothetical protein